MEIQRLVAEDDDSVVAVDFHPRLTVAYHENPVIRRGFLISVLHALGAGRAGLHLELVDGTNHKLAVFRPRGGSHRVVDIDTGADVSARYQLPDGRADLLARLGVDHFAAVQLLRCGAADMPQPPGGWGAGRPSTSPGGGNVARGSSGTDNDADAAFLASLDQARLWAAALAARDADIALARARAALPGVGAAQLARAEHLQQAEEARTRGVELHRPIARFGTMLAVGCLIIGLVLLALDARIADNGFTGWLLVILGLLASPLATFEHFRTHQARRIEQASLARAAELAGGSSSDGGRDAPNPVFAAPVSHLADPWRRQALAQALEASERCGGEWQALAGGVSSWWALRHRSAIESLAAQHGGARANGVQFGVQLDQPAAGVQPGQPRSDDPAVGAHAPLLAAAAKLLSDRLGELRAVGADRERLPLLLDEPFAGMDPEQLLPLVETLVARSADHQIVLITGDPLVRDWVAERPADDAVRLVRLGRFMGPSAPGISADRGTGNSRGKRGSDSGESGLPAAPSRATGPAGRVAPPASGPVSLIVAAPRP
ncbi:MAG: hypothetical protein ACKV2O_11465 [Acidimicrobiales bacterium]